MGWFRLGSGRTRSAQRSRLTRQQAREVLCRGVVRAQPVPPWCGARVWPGLASWVLLSLSIYLLRMYATRYHGELNKRKAERLRGPSMEREVNAYDGWNRSDNDYPILFRSKLWWQIPRLSAGAASGGGGAGRFRPPRDRGQAGPHCHTDHGARDDLRHLGACGV